MCLNHSKTATSHASSISFSRASEQTPLISGWITAGNKGFTQAGKLSRCAGALNLHNFGSSKLVASFVIRVPGVAFGPQLFVRDPARRGFHAISGLQDIGKLVDSVLYVAK
jgi:hypothetical protein